MPERIAYPTERPSVELRQLIPEDADAYFEAVNSSREHLSQHGDITAQKYPDLESVALSIEYPVPKDKFKLRMGIWDEDTFVGSINLRPLPHRVEIGYWLDERYLHNGYATLAVKALAARTPRYTEVFAAINVKNQVSMGVIERAGFQLDSSDGDVEYFVYRSPKPTEQQEPVLFSQALGRTDAQSIARIGLRGLNAPVINHGSLTTYEVLYGTGRMSVGGVEHHIYEGAVVTVPRGIPYQDEGHVVMLATSTPPFDSAKVERLEEPLL